MTTEVEGPFGVPLPEREQAANLKAEELNLFDSTAVAVSSVAPAYSLAATMVLLFTTAGVAYAGPAVIWVSFIPVVFIAVSYFHLNRKDPDCGASYSWLSKLISPYFGWFNGWVQIATSVIFCVVAPLLAGQYTIQFAASLGWCSQTTVNSIPWISVIGAIWLGIITFICVWGIRWTTNFQWMMVIIEYVCVVGFSLWGILKVAITHPAGSRGFNIAWFNPLNIKGFGALAAGAVLGIFFFWGWDTALNLTEESKDSRSNPGRAGIISMYLLLFVFLLNIVAAQMLLPPAVITAQGSNILFYFANHAVGTWAGYVMIVAVLSSTVGTTQTTLLPAARITYSMARDRVFPRVFGTIEGKRQTPAIGTLIIAFLCLFGILLVSQSKGAYNVLQNDLYGDIGVLIAFYYGVTGLACGWAFRKVVFKSVRFFFMGILFPITSGIILLLIGYKVFHDGWFNPANNTALPIAITMILGVILVIVARIFGHSGFFKTKVIAYDTIE